MLLISATRYTPCTVKWHTVHRNVANWRKKITVVLRPILQISAKLMQALRYALLESRACNQVQDVFVQRYPVGALIIPILALIPIQTRMNNEAVGANLGIFPLIITLCTQ